MLLLLLLLLSGRNDIDAGIVFEGYTAKFCLAMLVLDMLAKCTAIRSFIRLHKEIEEAGAIHHRDDPNNRSTTTRHGQPTKTEQRGIGETGGGTNDMGPWSMRRQEGATIASPQGKTRTVCSLTISTMNYYCLSVCLLMSSV